MQRAISLGELGRPTSPPNPWVGCVVVADGTIVGEGYHRAAGDSHAEAIALTAAGQRARGATAYVTLEPCVHQGRTPPCVGALLAAGVARVVVAVQDPDVRVRGKGVEHLRAAGIRVDVGVLAEEATSSLAPYLLQRSAGRAYVVLKIAATLDGRTAAEDGSSRWITGAAARSDGHRLRSESQAVIVGAGTALADRPALTVRDAPLASGRQPLRVLLDATGRVPAEGPLFDTSLAPTLVLTTASAPSAAKDAWRGAGAEVADVPAADGGGVNLPASLAFLGSRGVLQAVVEGGPTLHGALVRGGLADRLVLYVGGKTLGANGKPVFGGPGPRTIEDAGRWRLVDVVRLAQDVRLDYLPDREAA